MNVKRALAAWVVVTAVLVGTAPVQAQPGGGGGDGRIAVNGTQLTGVRVAS
jgi:hypothetical protein